MDNIPATNQAPLSRGCLGCMTKGVAVLGFLAVAIIAFFGALWAIGGILIISDPLEEVDAIVLLSGGDRLRWDEAVRLYQKQTANRIILTETDAKIGGSATRYSLLVRNNISAMGVPMDHIQITREIATSTYEEAHSVLDWMQAMGYQSCVVVTDPYHTFRTRLIFHDVFRGSDIEVRIRSVQGHWYQSADWMFSRQGWETTLLELGKLAGYLAGIR